MRTAPEELGFLGGQGHQGPIPSEAASVQLRAEFFNIPNHTNLGYSECPHLGRHSDRHGAYSEKPLSSAGQITTTAAPSRQIQLALRIIW